jgi:predicted glutamine amidotransferase
MTQIVELLLAHNMIFKKLHPIENKRLQTRKKIAIYEGVDLHSNYVAIFYLVQKSRFLRKNADEIESLFERLKTMQDHNYKKRVLLYDMPLCSKAAVLLKERGWRLIDVAS